MFSLLFAGKKGLVEALVFFVFFKVIASSYHDLKRKSLFEILFLFVFKP
tara:strand:- start:252 stop:398 length:147 start_codon:yes stop_codon:yes gene_type:complete